MRPVATITLVVILLSAGIARAQAPEGIFMLRSTANSPDAVAAAIRVHAEQRKWMHLGETPLRNGEVLLVKLCMPEVARLLWPLGLQLSAMLLCGNVGIYRKGDATEISVLHRATCTPSILIRPRSRPRASARRS